MQTENFSQLAIAWKTEMSDKLSKAEISDISSSVFKTGRNTWNPNLVTRERHKMELQAKIHQIKFSPLPKESIFVEANKLIRRENSEMLSRAKEERMVQRAIQSLEKSFSEYRDSTKLSLIELERLNKRKENARFSRNTNEHEKSKIIDSEYFLKNFLTIYKSLQCEKSSDNKRSEHIACRSGLEKHEKNLKNLRDKKFKRDCEIFPYGAEIVDVDIDGSKFVGPESAGNKSDYCNNDEKNKLYPSPRDIPSNDNYEAEIALENSEESTQEKIKTQESKTTVISHFFHKFKLLRYWKAWRKFTLRTRIDKEKLTRINKIDLFLKRLTQTVHNGNITASKRLKSCAVKNSYPVAGKTSRKKCIKSVSVTETDKNLDRIENELSKSAVEVYEHLRRGLKKFHPNVRPKIKVLWALPKIKKTSYAAEIKRNYPVPTFLVKMENRCKERKKRWEDIDRRKREIQAEKEQIEKEREEEKMKMEELRKKEKLEELIKKRLERKKAEEERNIRKQLLKKKIVLAQEHYKMYLKKIIGFEPWKDLVKIRRAQLQEADHYSQMRISKLHIKYWRNYTLMQIKKKCEKADEMYNYILLKRSFTLLINDYNETITKLQVALDWLDAKLAEKIFKIWLQYIRKERRYAFIKEEAAKSNYNRVITNKYFKKWKTFPEYMRNKKQKEIRKRQLQRRVQEFLPDYQPACVLEF